MSNPPYFVKPQSLHKVLLFFQVYTVGRRTDSLVHPQSSDQHRHLPIIGHWRIHAGKTVWMSQVWKKAYFNLFFPDKKEVQGQTFQKKPTKSCTVKESGSFNPLFPKEYRWECVAATRKLT